MKKFLFLLASIIALILLSPWITGWFIEYQIKHYQQRLVQQEDNIKLISQDYQRHWFSSKIQSQFEIKLGDTLAPQQVDFQHQIHHGFQPIEATSVDGQLILSSLPTNEIKHFQLESQPLLFHSVINSALQQQHQLRTEAITLRTDAPATLTLQTVLSSAEINSKKFLQNATLHVAQFNYAHSTGTVKGQTLSFNSDWQPSAWGSILKSAVITLAKLNLQTTANIPIELQQNQLTGTNIFQQSLLNSQWLYRAQRWQVGKQNYDAPQFELLFQRWHLPTLVQLQYKLANIMNLPEYQRSVILLEVLTQQLATLVSYQPEILLKNATFHNEFGKTELFTHIRLVPATMKAVTNPETLLLVEGNLQLPRTQLAAWIAQDNNDKMADYQINALITQGIFKEKPEQRLEMQFKFAEGQLSFK